MYENGVHIKYKIISQYLFYPILYQKLAIYKQYLDPFMIFIVQHVALE